MRIRCLGHRQAQFHLVFYDLRSKGFKNLICHCLKDRAFPNEVK